MNKKRQNEFWIDLNRNSFAASLEELLVKTPEGLLKADPLCLVERSKVIDKREVQKLVDALDMIVKALHEKGPRVLASDALEYFYSRHEDMGGK